MTPVITLSPASSLALRRAIEALKADDSLYDQCPRVVRDAILEIYMPPMDTYEQQMQTMQEAGESVLRLLEKFAVRLKAAEGKRVK